MITTISDTVLEELSSRVAAEIGLYFPRERWQDLTGGVAKAARERGHPDVPSYVQGLLSAPFSREEIDALASHLTVGETYFFREKQSFEALEKQVLPLLIARRRSSDRRLRIWSAGCCTGEEPYSIAILLDRLIPDLAEWSVTILATDINTRFLDFASAGSFGEWSFRSTPARVRGRYFSALPGGRFQIDRRIRAMVTFSVLNLAEDIYPSLVNNTTAMDLVICRNVLMYFTPEMAARAVDGFHRALLQDGWLLAAPCELSQTLFQGFTVVGFPGATFYRKTADPILEVPVADGGLAVLPPLPPPPVRLPGADIEAGTYSPAELAKVLANEGRLAEADVVCRQAISLDPLNASFRFLQALVAQERGMLDEATKSLRKALYLDKDFVMAHFALANLGRRLGRPALSSLHFRIALNLLERSEFRGPLRDSDGLSAERLAEVIRCAVAEGAKKR